MEQEIGDEFQESVEDELVVARLRTRKYWLAHPTEEKYLARLFSLRAPRSTDGYRRPRDLDKSECFAHTLKNYSGELSLGWKHRY